MPSTPSKIPVDGSLVSRFTTMAVSQGKRRSWQASRDETELAPHVARRKIDGLLKLSVLDGSHLVSRLHDLVEDSLGPGWCVREIHDLKYRTFRPKPTGSDHSLGPRLASDDMMDGCVNDIITLTNKASGHRPGRAKPRLRGAVGCAAVAAWPLLGASSGPRPTPPLSPVRFPLRGLCRARAEGSRERGGP